MQKLKIKVNEKIFQCTLSFINSNFGKPSSLFDVETENYPYRIMWIKPTEENQYHILTTLGLHLIKFPYLPKKVEGVELFIRLPQTWDLEKSDWPLRLIDGIVSSLLKGEVMNPGSTYRFLKELDTNTKQCAAVVHYSMLGLEKTVCQFKKKDILFLEIQTLYEDEWEKIIARNEAVIEKLYSLPYADLNRETFVKD